MTANTQPESTARPCAAFTVWLCGDCGPKRQSFAHELRARLIERGRTVRLLPEADFGADSTSQSSGDGIVTATDLSAHSARANPVTIVLGSCQPRLGTSPAPGGQVVYICFGSGTPHREPGVGAAVESHVSHLRYPARMGTVAAGADWLLAHLEIRALLPTEPNDARGDEALVLARLYDLGYL